MTYIYTYMYTYMYILKSNYSDVQYVKLLNKVYLMTLNKKKDLII